MRISRITRARILHLKKRKQKCNFPCWFLDALGEANSRILGLNMKTYMGRHVDYYNSWNEEDEAELAAILKKLPCKFMLSTWSHNPYRHNPIIEKHWHNDSFQVQTLAHYYHVGPTEELRNPMVEALITNYEVPRFSAPRVSAQQYTLDL